MADKKVAAGASVVFCILVVLLLVILYYPDQSEFEDGPLEEWTPTVQVQDFTVAAESPMAESTLTQLSKTLEEIGISVLVLIAVIFVVFGIACITCSCCCIV